LIVDENSNKHSSLKNVLKQMNLETMQKIRLVAETTVSTIEQIQTNPRKRELAAHFTSSCRDYALLFWKENIEISGLASGF
jgi:hypothetical protein